MAKNHDVRSKLLELLSENPSIVSACKKVGISRMTFYRWQKDNIEFRKQVDHALENGRKQWIEIAEMGLMKLIKDTNLGAIKFFLVNNDRRYGIKSPLDPLTPEERHEYEKKRQEIPEEPLSDDKLNSIVDSLERFGILKKDAENDDNSTT